MPKCSVDWCEKDAEHLGFCNSHYRRLRKYGDPLMGGSYKKYKNKGEVCRALGCKCAARTGGLCCKHYERLHDHGDIYYSGPKDHRFLEHKREWKTWDGMKQRCYNPKCKSYKHYGLRGVKVCDRWLGRDGFLYFYLDMGNKPEGSSLDRIDVNGDYCPENCRWATPLEQACNRRTNASIPGVRYNSKNPNKKWSAYATIHGTRYYKSFYTKEEAIAQRELWVQNY